MECRAWSAGHGVQGPNDCKVTAVQKDQKEYSQELSINVRIVNDMSAKSVRPAAWYLV